jgi:pimeloyl-ACP methyl ester carboxylesterase
MSYFKYVDKNVYFKIYGDGTPLIMLHGNTSSSKIFSKMAKALGEKFKVILIDLPGYGKSDRPESLPLDFWYENAFVVAGLIKYLGLGKTAILGTGGGAILAINIALEFPDTVLAVIADSFEGESSVGSYVEKLEEDRRIAMKIVGGSFFWKLMNGKDWKKVVEQDTLMIKSHHEKVGRFFHKSLEELKCPVLLMGGLKDRYIPNISEVYRDLEKKIPKSETVIFENGRHPALLYCMKDSIGIVVEYLEKNI